MRDLPQGSKPILVTGADGFLGANITRALMGEGYPVRAFVQTGRRTDTIDGLELELVEGDIMKREDRIAALSGASAVIHTAASTAVWPSRDPFLRKLNVHAALDLAREAKMLGVKRMVHVGTANSFAAGSLSSPGDESGPYSAGRFGLDYQDTKREAQDALLALGEEGPEVVIVNPTFMFGPYDAKPGPGAMILAVAKGRVPGSAPGGRSFASVGDVASGTVRALERGVPGRCYILGGHNLSYADAFAKIAEVVGAVPPRRRMPCFAVLTFGAFSSLAAHMTRNTPAVSLAMARISCEGQYYSSSRARAELGYSISPLEEAVRAAWNWFRERGLA